MISYSTAVKFPLLYIQQNANVKYKFVFGIKTGVSNRWTNIECCISFVLHAQIQINCPPSVDKSAFFDRKAKNAAKKHFKNYLKVQNIFHNGLIFWKSFCIITEYKDTLGSKRANRPVSELGERVKLS